MEYGFWTWWIGMGPLFPWYVGGGGGGCASGCDYGDRETYYPD